MVKSTKYPLNIFFFIYIFGYTEQLDYFHLYFITVEEASYMLLCVVTKSLRLIGVHICTTIPTKYMFKFQRYLCTYPMTSASAKKEIFIACLIKYPTIYMNLFCCFTFTVQVRYLINYYCASLLGMKITFTTKPPRICPFIGS